MFVKHELIAIHSAIKGYPVIYFVKTGSGFNPKFLLGGQAQSAVTPLRKNS